MNIKLFPECRLSVTVKELMTKFSFGNEAEDCMVGKCDVFSTSQISIDNCNAESASEKDTSSPSNVSDIEDENENLGEHSIVYYESACGQDNKLTKILSKKIINENIDLFKRTIGALKKHIEFYDEVKNNLSRNEIVVHVNYSENYENKHQREIQSAYFGYTTFSIFNAYCYVCDVTGKVICKSVTISTELPDHSRSAAITCVLKLIDYLREKYQHLPLRL